MSRSIYQEQGLDCRGRFRCRAELSWSDGDTEVDGGQLADV